MNKEPEVLSADEFQFMKAGGGTGVVLRLIGSALKWVGIGFFFHLGWKFLN